MSAFNGVYEDAETVGPQGRVLTAPCLLCAPDYQDTYCPACEGVGEVTVYTLEEKNHDRP